VFEEHDLEALENFNSLKINEKEIESKLKLLTTYIKENYIEIDTNETDKKALSALKNKEVLLFSFQLRS